MNLDILKLIVKKGGKMKVIFCSALIVLFYVSFLSAAGFNFTFDTTTGDIGLDAEIHDINFSAKGNTDGALKELSVSYGMEIQISVNIMNKYNLTFGEMHLLGVYKILSGKSIDEILALRQQGLGWGQLAHKLNIHPSVLNKEIRGKRKANKGFKQKGKGHGGKKHKGKGKK